MENGVPKRKAHLQLSFLSQTPKKTKNQINKLELQNLIPIGDIYHIGTDTALNKALISIY